MSSQRPIIYCAFSNDADQSLRLSEEENIISIVLTELDKQGKIEYKHKDKASLDNIYDFFNNYHNRIFIFHYGGHSDSEFLHLQEESAISKELAMLIGQQKHLKLVFLNGCANRAQVRPLLEKGVSAVIATLEAVGDKQAIILAEQFYKALANGKTLLQSFEAAESYLKQKHTGRELIRDRGLLRLRTDSFDQPFPWGLYYEEEEVLNWHIGGEDFENKIETLSQLREASRNRYQRLTGPGGRFQHLDIKEAILSGIRDLSSNQTALFEDNVDLNGKRVSFQESISSSWGGSNFHFLLVGVGGMGKTVSLLSFWKAWAEEEREDSPVPVFIQLNEFNNNPEPNFIQNYIRRHYVDLELDEILKTPAFDQNGNPRPQILLLLDGFNEVAASSNELISEINRLQKQDDYPGIQMVISSRVDIRLVYQWQSFHLLELLPLSDSQVQTYLHKNIPSDSRLFEILRNPMMLSIYAAQMELPQSYLLTGLLKDQVTSVGEILYNVEVIQRIKIEEQYNLQIEALTLCRFLLEHFLPYLGWTMQQAGSYFIEGQALLDFLGTMPGNLLKQDFFLVFNDFRKLNWKSLEGKETWELQEELIDQICCKRLTMLVEENKTYRFLHQNFRDYFAAKYLLNQISLALHQKSLPLAFQQAPLDFYVRQMLGELEGEHTNKTEWNKLEKKWQWSKGNFFLDNNIFRLLEQCRNIFDEEQLGFTVWNLLTLWKEQRGELSGADLRQLNFHGFSINSLCASRPGLSADLSGSLLKADNLFHQGHSQKINCVAFSPDGCHIVSGSNDHTAKVWDNRTGQCLLTLNGHSEGIRSVAYSPDGTRIATGSADKSVKVWDAQTGIPVFEIKGHYGRVASVTYNPDGSRIATGSSDQKIRLWIAQTGEWLQTLDGHSGEVRSLSYSPDGSRIISGSTDSMIKVWDAHTGQCTSTIEGHTKGVNSVTFSPDGQFIVSGSNDNSAKIWNVQSGKCLWTLESHTLGVRDVEYSPDGRRIVSGSDDTTAKIWDAQTGKCLLTLDGHSHGVNSIAYSPNRNVVITGAIDKTTKAWDVQTGQCLLVLGGHSEGVRSIAYNPNGALIVSGSNDHTIKVWDAKTWICLLIMKGHSGGIISVAYSSDGSRIVTGSNDNTAKIWNSSTGQCLLTIEHSGGVRSVDYNPDGSRVVTGSDDNAVKVWDAITGQCLLDITGHSEGVRCVAYSPDGSRIASESYDNTAKIWDAQTGELHFVLEGNTSGGKSLAYSPDGSHIVRGLADKTAKVWDAQTGIYLQTLEGHSDMIAGVAYSPNGNYIFTSAWNMAKVWNAQTGECLLSIKDNWKGGISVVYSPDGNYILSESKDQTIKTWDPQTGEYLSTSHDISGLYIQGCDFRNHHPNSDLSPESITTLRQYGAIFKDEDAKAWAGLLEKHFGIKSVYP